MSVETTLKNHCGNCALTITWVSFGRNWGKSWRRELEALKHDNVISAQQFKQRGSQILHSLKLQSPGVLVLAENGPRDTCKVEEVHGKQVWTMWQVSLSRDYNGKKKKSVSHWQIFPKKIPNFLHRPVIFRSHFAKVPSAFLITFRSNFDSVPTSFP